MLIFGGIREYLMVSLVDENFDTVGEDILANYDKALWERYHLFFLDPRESSYLVSDATDRMEEKLGENPGFFHGVQSEITVEQRHSVVENDGEALREQIKQWEICQGVTKLPEVIKQLWDGTKEKDAISKELSACENENPSQNTKEELGEEQEETGEQRRIREIWREWKAVLEGIFENGILYYVAEDIGNLSPLQLEEGQTLPSERFGEKKKIFDSNGFSFTELSQLKNLCEDGWQPGNVEEKFSSDLFLFPYIFECFSDYRTEDKEKTHCLQYEIEYLIGGSHKDKENLKCVADQLFLMRFMTNYTYAVQDSKISAEAEAMALALTGMFGFPQGQKIVKQLLIAALCYGESLLEVRALFRGDTVAVLKSKENWNVSFSTVAMKLKNRSNIIAVKKGVDYDNYLMFLILLRVENKNLLYRMMDIMQCNVALDEPGFRMEEALASFRWTGKFSWNPWIKKIPVFGLLQREPFSITRERDIFYR